MMAVRITKKLLKELETNPQTILAYDTKTIKKIFDKLDDDYHNKGLSFLSDDVYDYLKDIVSEQLEQSEQLKNSNIDLGKVGAPPAKKQKVVLDNDP